MGLSHHHWGRDRSCAASTARHEQRPGPVFSRERSCRDPDSHPARGAPPQGLSETLREGGTGRWVFRARTGGGWPHPEAPVVTYLSGACASFSPVHPRPEPALQETRRESASPGVPGYVASVEQAPINHGCRRATTGARNSFRRCPRKTARALKS